MKKVLIASVGGSAEPIVNAIASTQPDFVYFLCSTGTGGSDETVESTIVPAARRAAGSYAVERVQLPNDMRDIVAGCGRIEADLDARFADEDLEVIVNYTGGTRSMAAGLGSLAGRRGWSAEWTERPARKWSGPVSKVSLDAVTVFSGLSLHAAEGINVIIGENGSGKTHLLKCAYAVLRAAEEAERELPVPPWGDKLTRLFSGGFRSLFAGEGEAAHVRVECGDWVFERIEHPPGLAAWSLPAPVRTRTLFLPSREPLAMYAGFVSAYEKRDLAFDETYYDVCRELGQRELREPAPEFKAVLDELERVIGGEVRLNVSAFVVETKRGPIAAPMVAEGHRKLAALAYLIKTGALTSETILFWDEPEANLNPKLVRVVAQVLRKLGKAGVQVFVATHDYLLARELSLEAEYRPSELDTRFFVLHRGSDDEPVAIAEGASWVDLQENPIFEAYAAHYERERELFTGEVEEVPS
jgi:energy-coupling factor transporter ATP-binding protein EcfA2